MVEMFVYRVALDMEHETAVVVLADEPVQRLLPIYIRIFEAQAIAMELHGETPPRPYTHDLLAAVIRAVGWKLDRITITDVRENTFFALLTLSGPGPLQEIDARPSDSIALALRLDAPIFVEDTVLERAEWHAERVADDVEAFQQLMERVQISDSGAQYGLMGAPEEELAEPEANEPLPPPGEAEEPPQLV